MTSTVSEGISGFAARLVGPVAATGARFVRQLLGLAPPPDGRIRDAMFRSFFENASVGMVIVDQNGVLLDCNQAWCRFSGFERTERVGRSMFELTLPDEVEADQARRVEVVRGASAVWQRDKRYIHKDGSIVWATVTVSAMERDASGQATTLMAVIQDINARKKLEAELANTRELLELAVRSSDVAVFTVEMPDGRWSTGQQRFINCFEPLGYPAPAEYVTRDDLARLLPPHEMPRVPRHVRDYLKGTVTSFEIEHQVRHRDGSPRWKISRGAAVRNEQGHATRFVGTLIDVTDKRLVEKELRESEARLRNLMDALPLLVWSATARGDVNYYGAQFFAYSGLTNETLNGASWLDVVHPEDREASRRA
ncbi:MAG TPA: PAS domain S-box protein, partial [Polyangiales bacterium]|nr:PAS domain S-box protein [Polyangiales bacterium]